MWRECLEHLRDWTSFDTWILLTAATTALVCAVPGVWLVLRRQSMLGDALSHTVLPGVVGAFLLVNGLQAAGWVSSPGDSKAAHGAAADDSKVDGWGEANSAYLVEQTLLVIGAALSGMLTAMLTEAVSRWGRIEAGAALGVVFSTFFALGLLLIRLFADKVHLDVDCVLMGQLESSVLHTMQIGPWRVPNAVVSNIVMFVLLAAITLVAFKELQLTSFDPGFAGSLGLRTAWIQQLLSAMTAIAVVASFRTVGSILVIALLVGPAVSGRLMSDKLGRVFLWSLALAVTAVALGYAMAKSVPPVLFPRLGYESVRDAGASGLIAVACGIVFGGVLILAPRDGVIVRIRDWFALQVKITAEDILGFMYRCEERGDSVTRDDVRLIAPTWSRPFALRELRRNSLVADSSGRYVLTSAGRAAAQALVRAHRLWESYMAKHFDLSAAHLHETAHSVEHYIDADLRAELTEELDQPSADPHGRDIPPAG
jgi:manganese/zinc/iron transport system permease protein